MGSGGVGSVCRRANIIAVFEEIFVLLCPFCFQNNLLGFNETYGQESKDQCRKCVGPKDKGSRSSRRNLIATVFWKIK